MQGHVETADKGERFALRHLIWVFVIVVVAGLVLAATLNTGNSPGTILQIFTLRFLGIFIEAAPFLLLGTIVSGLIEAFVSREDIVRWVPRNPVLATFAGALMGFTFPVCECGVVPVTRRLFNKGLPMSVGVTFLLAAPFMNPIVMVGTYIAFWQIAPVVVIGRFVITALVAIAIGLIFALGARPQDVLRPQSLAPVMGGSGDLVIGKTKRKPLSVGLKEALTTTTDEFFEMGRYMIVGSMLAAGLQTLVAQETLLALGQGPVLSVLTMQVLAFVLSVCSTVDAFIALAFFGTFTTGSILAFLTFGPMVDIKSTLMFLGVFRRRVVVYLILLPFLMTLLIGIWTNLVLRV
jgi:uncharacterized membrane protein YraQ (UPF0718 family)